MIRLGLQEADRNASRQPFWASGGPLLGRQGRPRDRAHPWIRRHRAQFRQKKPRI